MRKTPRIGFRRLRHLRQNLKRLRHRKGFGVHSPYVYRLVREVFSKRICDAKVDRSLVEGLLTMGLKRSYVVEISNFILDSQGCEVVVCSRERSIEYIDNQLTQAKQSGATIIIIDHNATVERELYCRDVVDRHISTSIDKKGYLILINNHLPKQHFLL